MEVNSSKSCIKMVYGTTGSNLQEKQLELTDAAQRLLFFNYKLGSGTPLISYSFLH